MIIAIICQHYTKNKSKQKALMHLKYKMENNEFKVRNKNHTCYYFDDIIELEGFDMNNILID